MSDIDNDKIIYNKCSRCPLQNTDCDLKSNPKIAGCIMGTYGEIMKGEHE